MYTYTQSFSIRTLFLLTIAGAILIPIATRLGAVAEGDELTPWLIAAVAVGIAGALFIFYALVIAVLLLAQAKIDIQERTTELAAITPRLRELQAVRLLTPEQIALVTKLEHRAHIVGKASRDNKAWAINYWLSTPGGDVPIEFTVDFFRSSGALYLTPVRRYTEGSINQQYARALTDWARENGLAVGGEGSQAGKAAEWITPAARAEVFNLFDINTEPD
jgi:hypothetical protein